MSFARRCRTILLLAVLLVPLASHADDAPPAVSEPSPPAPAQAPPSPAAPAAAAALRPVRAAPAATTGIDRTKQYYVFFEQTITAVSITALRKQLATLIEAGVTEITIVVSSPGGQWAPALNAYAFIRALPAHVSTHAEGLVASAANVLFLAGQDRSADRNAQFLYHPSVTSVPPMANEEQIKDQLTMLSDVDAAVASIYRERTKLSEADIQRSRHETVIFDTDKALEQQVVQKIEDLRFPADQKAKFVFVE